MFRNIVRYIFRFIGGTKPKERKNLRNRNKKICSAWNVVKEMKIYILNDEKDYCEEGFMGGGFVPV